MDNEMNMYNLLFGKNPYSDILKAMLNLGNEEGKTHVGRFRDIYLKDNGTKIIVYTRNGGGNRECYDCDKESTEDIAGCQKTEDDNCFWTKDCCPLKANAEMSLHPNFIRDYDDDYDCTYAYHEFTVPEKFLQLAKLLSGEEEPNVTEKFNVLIKEMKDMPPEDFVNDERFKPFKDLFEKLVEKD